MRRFETWKVRKLSGCALLVLLAVPAVAMAQQASAILGQVRDESGGVLPGVTVSVSSPSLQVKEVTDVTNAQGEYRITPLPIGTYSVSYSLDGFSTMRQEGIRLDLGAQAKLDIMLKVGTLTETVTVSGASPVVDVTATSASTQFTRETLELTPTSRNGAISLMVQAPGVRAPGRLDVGGGTVGDTPEFASFGQPIESFMAMEGLVTSDYRIQTQGGNYFDYNAMEEAKVQTISNGPEVPSRGPALTMLLKSGGNEFHGGGSYAYSSEHTESDNIDDELRAQGITEGNPLLSRTDQGLDIGGRIVRDKLWFYTSGRYRPQDVIQLGTYKPDGTPGNGYKAEIILNQKISYQPRQSTRLVFWNQWVQKYHYADTLTRFQAWSVRGDRVPPIRSLDVEDRVAGSQEQPRDVRAVRPLDLDGWPERGVCRTHGRGRSRRRPAGARNPDVQRRITRRRRARAERSDLAVAGWSGDPAAAAGTTSGAIPRRRR